MQRRGEYTRQLIINKAAILFTRNGYSNTSLSQILAATHLAKGGFYFHFKSKEELGAAVIDSLEKYWHNQLLPSLAAGRDAIAKLDIMLGTPGDCLSTPDCIRPTILLLNLATEMIEVHDSFSQRLKTIVQEWWQTIEGIIEEGKQAAIFKQDVDAAAVAAIILSNIMGANLLALLNEDLALYKKQLSSLKKILLNGIVASANPRKGSA